MHQAHQSYGGAVQAAAYSEKDAAPDTELGAVIKRGDSALEYAAHLANSIESAADRLIGEAPTPISSPSQNALPPPFSVVGKLNANVDATYAQLDRISKALERLNAAI